MCLLIMVEGVGGNQSSILAASVHSTRFQTHVQFHPSAGGFDEEDETKPSFDEPFEQASLQGGGTVC